MSYNQNEEYQNIPREKFAFVQEDKTLHDTKLDTKPVGYFRDAFNRFRKNKGSIVCSIIILILIVYAIFTPIFAKVKPSQKDGYYSYALPKANLFSKIGIWDGCKDYELNQVAYDYNSAIPGAIKEENGTVTKVQAAREQLFYKVSLDSYKKVGYVSLRLTKEKYQSLCDYEKSSGVQLMYPIIDQDKVENRAYKDDQNAWFLTDQKGVAIRDGEGNLQNIYMTSDETEDGYLYYQTKMNGDQYIVRVDYYKYYVYLNGHEPCFLFGADTYGYDIFSRLAAGARFSLLLSVVVGLATLVIGVIIGALEGYYGGLFDLLFERFKEIIWEVPTIAFMTLFSIYFSKKLGIVFTVFVAFVFFSWMGTSSTVRAQFYRFKGQEYVMAARTLGAKDKRLIFRHILPNGIGFIITSTVLMIPGVIFSEAVFSYLGVINLESPNMTSVGTMLNTGQTTLSTFPHCIFFPAAFIAILLICFNIFGNGLRDAFNPSLRGADE